VKLWLLRPVDNLPNGDNPWEPWYDKAFGFVVRAKNEQEAREFATAEAGDENRGEFLGNKTAGTKQPWLIYLAEKYNLGKEILKDFRRTSPLLESVPMILPHIGNPCEYCGASFDAASIGGCPARSKQE
jgi:hypothetical protein